METDRKALADRFVGLLAEWANANEDWKDAYDWADEPEMHAAALEKERIQGEIIAAASALREEGEAVVISRHRVHERLLKMNVYFGGEDDEILMHAVIDAVEDTHPVFRHPHTEDESDGS